MRRGGQRQRHGGASCGSVFGFPPIRGWEYGSTEKGGESAPTLASSWSAPACGRERPRLPPLASPKRKKIQPDRRLLEPGGYGFPER